MTQQKMPWWRTEEYVQDDPLPNILSEDGDGRFAGPNGIALVRAWPDGRTDKGWGLQGPKKKAKDGTVTYEDGFMPRYLKDEFSPRRVLHGYKRDLWAFAIVMRSVRLVCIDIDGKNGGLEHAKRLGALPVTLAETSKSGDGFHLFYLVDETWDAKAGYASLNDRIGLEQGVDIRATGCVYHHKQQRWNERPVANLPDYLVEQLKHRDQKIAATNARIKSTLANQDELEILMMQDELTAELAKPIPAGKRNNTLFAIGSQMQQAEVENWDEKLRDRGTELGLDHDEIEKLVGNIERYA